MMKSSLLPILLITGLNAQQFSASLNASGGDSNYDMTFGFHPDATDGYDADYDMYAPPAPPPLTFVAH